MENRDCPNNHGLSSASAVLNHLTMIHVAPGESMFQPEKHSTATKTYLGQFRTLRLFLLLSIVVRTSLVNCQAPQHPPDQAADASANVNQICFDLVAHDKKGRPVLDLKPAEIAVTFVAEAGTVVTPLRK